MDRTMTENLPPERPQIYHSVAQRVIKLLDPLKYEVDVKVRQDWYY